MRIFTQQIKLSDKKFWEELMAPSSLQMVRLATTKS